MDKEVSLKPHILKESFVYAGEILEMELTCHHRTVWLLHLVQTDVPELLLKLSGEPVYKKGALLFNRWHLLHLGSPFLMPLKHENIKCACRYGHAHDCAPHTKTDIDTSILPASIKLQMSGNSLFSHDISSSAA